MSRQALLQIGLGVLVVALVWMAGYLAMTPPEHLPTALSWAAPVGRLLGGSGAPPDDAVSLSTVVVQYDEDEPRPGAVQVDLDIDGRPAGTLVIKLDGPATQNIRHLAALVQRGAYRGRGMVRPSAASAGAPDGPARGAGLAGRVDRLGSRLELDPSVVVFGAPEPGAARLDARSAGLMVAGEFVDDAEPVVGTVVMVRREDPSVFSDGTVTGTAEQEGATYRDSATYRFAVLCRRGRFESKNGQAQFDISRNFSIIGHVVDPAGLALLGQLAEVETGSTGRPIVPVTIRSIRLVEQAEPTGGEDRPTTSRGGR